jgi:hypothetical protein
MLNRFLLVCLFACVLVFSFCTNVNLKGRLSNVQKELLEKARQQIDIHPDSSLLFIDSLLRKVDEKNIKDPNLLLLLELKQQAFLKLRLMDSFYISGQRIREVASMIPDSLAMAKTLISLYGGIHQKGGEIHARCHFHLHPKRYAV